jgi:hypothetical protein
MISIVTVALQNSNE